MNFKETESLSLEERVQIRNIWNNEYPKVLYQEKQETLDSEIKTLKNARHTLVVDEQQNVQGWYADFDRDEARWFLIILSASSQNKGIGTKLLQKAQQQNESLCGWVIFSDTYKKADGTFYKSPLAFYQKLGFKIHRKILFQSEIMETLKVEWKNKQT